MGTILWRDTPRPAFQITRTTPRAQGEGEPTQIAQSMGTIREGSRITGQVILTIPFFGQGGREASFPKGLRLLVGQPHDVGAQHEVIESPAQPVEHSAAISQAQARVEVLLIKATPDPAMRATVTGKRTYSRRHAATSMKLCLP